MRYFEKAKKTFSRLSIILTVAYGIFQYEQAKLDFRIKNTLEFHDKFMSSPFIHYRETINEILSKNRFDIVNAAKENKTYSEFIISFVERENISKQLDMTFEFYDGLAACISNGLCDGDTAYDLFRPATSDLIDIFNPYIMNIRKNYNGEYANGILFIGNFVKNKSWFRSLVKMV